MPINKYDEYDDMKSFTAKAKQAQKDFQIEIEEFSEELSKRRQKYRDDFEILQAKLGYEIEDRNRAERKLFITKMEIDRTKKQIQEIEDNIDKIKYKKKIQRQQKKQDKIDRKLMEGMSEIGSESHQEDIKLRRKSKRVHQNHRKRKTILQKHA